MVGRFILLCFAVSVAAVAGAGEAAAEVRRLSAPLDGPGPVVFRLAGISPETVRAAHVITGGRRWQIRRSRLRAAAVSGRLRIRRRELRRHGVRQPARGRARLVLWLERPPSVMPTFPSPPGEAGPPAVQPAPAPAPSPSPSPSPEPPHEPVTYHVSPGGADDGTGSEEAPWQTLQRALGAVAPGDTVVLHAGTYGSYGTRTTIEAGGTPEAPIRFTSDPREPPAILEGMVIVEGSHVRLNRLLFDGPTGPVDPTLENPEGEEVPLWINADHVELAGSEVRDSLWHAGVFLSGSAARISGSHIHDNGNFLDPLHANLDHGIYVGSGSAVIENNVIEHNVARGVQLYPGSSGVVAGVVVVNNTIVGNGRAGVQLDSELGGAVADTTVAGNIIARNGWSGIYDRSSTGTRVVANLFSGNAVGDPVPPFEDANLTASDPLFIDEDDYRLQEGSPAIGLADTAYAPSTDILGTPRDDDPDAGAYEYRLAP